MVFPLLPARREYVPIFLCLKHSSIAIRLKARPQGQACQRSDRRLEFRAYRARYA